MKLIGSKTEQDFRDRLIRSHNSLFQKPSYEKLLDVLRANFPDMKTAYVIGHTPEQGEDHYTVLINNNIITQFEIEHNSMDFALDIVSIPLRDYVQGLSKIEQIKISIAIDLAEKDLKNLPKNNL